MLWTYADDEGRGKDNPALIKAAIWPLDNDVTSLEVEDWQSELEQAGRIIRYGVDDRPLFQIVNWGKHQKPQRAVASLLQPPPGWLMEDSRTTRGDVRAVGGEVDEEKGRGRASKTRAPKMFDVTDNLRAWFVEHQIPSRVDVETEKWLDHHRAKGSMFDDWTASWRTWMRNAKKFAEQDTKPELVVVRPQSVGRCVTCGRLELDCLGHSA